MSTSEPFPYRNFLAPRFWPTWIGLGFLRSLAMLPFQWQLAIGRTIGRMLVRLPFPAREYARTNLRLCFPEHSQSERERLLRLHFENIGMALAEFASAWWASERQLANLETVEGLDNLTGALKQGRGVILLGMHFMNLDLAGRLLARHMDFSVMYRHQKNPLFDALMRRSRARIFDQAIERDDVRTLVRTLRGNGVVWYAPDQNYAGKGAVFVPFFGIAASTNSGTARLARMTGAPVVPFTHIRTPDGKGYRLIFGSVLEDFPGDDPEGDTARINAVIEQQVRRAPEQYLWVHRRFKDRPRGEARIY